MRGKWRLVKRRLNIMKTNSEVTQQIGYKISYLFVKMHKYIWSFADITDKINNASDCYYSDNRI